MAKAEPVKLAFEDVTVDRNAEVPIGVQLAWALRSRVDDGRVQSRATTPWLAGTRRDQPVSMSTRSVRSINDWSKRA